MPIWTVMTLDVWGNAAEGFEINNQFRSGEVYIPPPPPPPAPEADHQPTILEALIENGDLNSQALREFEANTLQIEEGDGTIEISETDTELVVENRHGERRWLDYSGTLEEARELATEEALNPDRDGNLLGEGERPDDITEAEDQRPLLILEAQLTHGGGPDEDDVALWRTTIHVPASSGNMTPDEHDLEVVVGYGFRPRGEWVDNQMLGVEVVLLNEGRPEASDRFEWHINDWQKKPHLGFDPLTREKLKPTKKQVEEILVATDQFLEKRR